VGAPKIGCALIENTASTPSSAASRLAGSSKSPRTTSTPGRAAIASGLRVMARTERPMAASWDSNCWPTWPVAPVIRMMPEGSLAEL
jgi:hypothetical protein